MKYLVMIGFITGNKEYVEGQFLEEKDMPKKSKTWLIKQGIIVKKTPAELKKEQEALMESLNMKRARNVITVLTSLMLTQIEQQILQRVQHLEKVIKNLS